MKVKIHLYSQSSPVKRKGVRNTYTKDGFFCVMLKNGTVEKYPIDHIFRVTETYKGKKFGQ